MIITPEGPLIGMIGGGCGERDVIEAAQDPFTGGPPRTVRNDLTDDLTSWSPAVCGGFMNVRIGACGPTGDGT